MPSQVIKNKKAEGILHIALNLTIACLISGIIISVTYFLTNDTAVRNSERLTNESMKQFVSSADYFKAIPHRDGWYKAMKGGKLIAYVVTSESKGYGGRIELLVAVDMNRKVVGVSITDNNETPGLGEKATRPEFTDQFKDKIADHLKVVKDKSDKADIQAVTGATISSKAVTQGVKNAITEVDTLEEGK